MVLDGDYPIPNTNAIAGFEDIIRNRLCVEFFGEANVQGKKRLAPQNITATLQVFSNSIEDGLSSVPIEVALSVIDKREFCPCLSWEGGKPPEPVHFLENGAPVAIAPTLLLEQEIPWQAQGESDCLPEPICGAEITLTPELGGDLDMNDVLSLNALSPDGAIEMDGNVEYDYVSMKITLRLMGKASAEEYCRVLRKITYSNSSDCPLPDSRIVSITVFDYSCNSNTLKACVQVFPSPDPPVLGGKCLESAKLPSTSENFSNLLTNAFTVDFPESKLPASMLHKLLLKVQLSEGFLAGTDILSLSPLNSPFVAEFNAASGLLVVSCADPGCTETQFASMLSSLQFSLEGSGLDQNPAPFCSSRLAPRNVRLSAQVFDLEADLASNVHHLDLGISDCRQFCPCLSWEGGKEPNTLVYAENGPALQVAPGLLLEHATGELICRAEITLSTELDSQTLDPNDLLEVQQLAAEADIVLSSSLSYQNALTLVLEGCAPAADYCRVLRKIAFSNSSECPCPKTRVVTVTVTDYAGCTSNVLRRFVQAVSTVDPPQLRLAGPASKVLCLPAQQPGLAELLQSAFAVTFPDANCASDTLYNLVLKVQLSDGFLPGNDCLSVDLGSAQLYGKPLTADFNQASGLLVVSCADGEAGGCTQEDFNNLLANLEFGLKGNQFFQDPAPPCSKRMPLRNVRVYAQVFNLDVNSSSELVHFDLAIADCRSFCPCLSWQGEGNKAPETMHFLENGDPAAVAPKIVLEQEASQAQFGDPNLVAEQICSAVVRIVPEAGPPALGLDPNDVLTVHGLLPGGLIQQNGALDSSNGVLTLRLTGCASAEEYCRVLSKISFSNASDAPVCNVRLVEFQVFNYSGCASNVLTRCVKLWPRADRPVLELAQGASPSVAVCLPTLQGDLLADAFNVTFPDSGEVPDDYQLRNLVLNVQMLDGFMPAVDCLTAALDNVSNPGAFDVNFNTISGALVVTCTQCTEADFQAMVASLEFSLKDPALEQPVAPACSSPMPPRNILFSLQVNDLDTGTSSNVQTLEMSVQDCRQFCPCLSWQEGADLSTLVIQENGAAAAVAPQISLEHATENQIFRADITLIPEAGASLDENDVLAANGLSPDHPVSAQVIPDTNRITLRLEGCASAAEYARILSKVTFSNSSNCPSPKTRILTFEVRDEAQCDSNVVKRCVQVITTTDPPVLQVKGPASKHTCLPVDESEFPQLLNNVFTMSLPDAYCAPNELRALMLKVQLGDGFEPGSDCLTVVVYGGGTTCAAPTVSFNQASGLLVVTSESCTEHDFDALLSSLKFTVKRPELAQSPAEPCAKREPLRSVRFSAQVFDLDAHSASNVEHFELAISDCRSFCPCLSWSGGGNKEPAPLRYDENGEPVLVSQELRLEQELAQLVLGDHPELAAEQICSATVQVEPEAGTPYPDPHDLLQVQGLSATGNIEVDETLTTNSALHLKGCASAAEYCRVLGKVLFSNTSECPLPYARIVSFQVTNYSGCESNTIKRCVNVWSLPDPPVVSIVGPSSKTECLPADPDLLGQLLNGVFHVRFPDSKGDGETLSSALTLKVWLSDGFLPGTDCLSVGLYDQSKFTVTFNEVTGALEVLCNDQGGCTENEFREMLSSLEFGLKGDEFFSDVAPACSTPMRPRNVRFSVQVCDLGANTASNVATFDLAICDERTFCPCLSWDSESGKGPETLVFVENSNPLPVAPGLLVEQISSSRQICSACVTLTPDAGQDKLDTSDVLQLLGSSEELVQDYYEAQDGSAITLSLTGCAPPEVYCRMLRKVTFSNTSECPDPRPRLVTITVKEEDYGGCESNALTRCVQAVATTDPPILSLVGDPSKQTCLPVEEPAFSTLVQDVFQVTLPDTKCTAQTTHNLMLRLQIGEAGFSPGVDCLSVPEPIPAGVTQNFNPASGLFVLSCAQGAQGCTEYDFNGLLASLQFSLKGAQFSQNPAEPCSARIPLRNVRFSAQVLDLDVNSASNVATFELAIADCREFSPCLGWEGGAKAPPLPVHYVENDDPVPLAPTLELHQEARQIALGDPDLVADQIGSATVTLTPELDAAELDLADTLEVHGLSPSENIMVGTLERDQYAKTVTLTLTGCASAAEYCRVLRKISFSNSSECPVQGARLVSFEVTNESGHVSNSVTRCLNVWSKADPPVVRLLGECSTSTCLPVVEAYFSQLLANVFDVSFPDSKDPASGSHAFLLKVRLSDGFVAGNDALAPSMQGVTDEGAFSVTFNEASGVLSVKGTDCSENDFRAMLRSLEFSLKGEAFAQDPAPFCSSREPPRNVRFHAQVFDLDANTMSEEVHFDVGISDCRTFCPCLSWRSGKDSEPAHYFENGNPLPVAPGLHVSQELVANQVLPQQVCRAVVKVCPEVGAQLDANDLLTVHGLSPDEDIRVRDGYPQIIGDKLVLELEGCASPEEYCRVLAKVSFSNSSEFPLGSTRVVEFQVFSAEYGAPECASNVLKKCVQVWPQVDPPILTVSHSIDSVCLPQDFSELLTDVFKVTFPDSSLPDEALLNLRLQVNLSDGFSASSDCLAVAAEALYGTDFEIAYNASAGILTVSCADQAGCTEAQFCAMLGALEFSLKGSQFEDPPAPCSTRLPRRNVKFAVQVFNDNANSASNVAEFNLGIADCRVFCPCLSWTDPASATETLHFVENQHEKLFPFAGVSAQTFPNDVSDNFTSTEPICRARITLANPELGLDNSPETAVECVATAEGNFSGTHGQFEFPPYFDCADGELGECDFTVTGCSTVEEYLLFLSRVCYSSAGDNPTPGTRVLTLTLYHDSYANGECPSNTLTRLVQVWPTLPPLKVEVGSRVCLYKITELLQGACVPLLNAEDALLQGIGPFPPDGAGDSGSKRRLKPNCYRLEVSVDCDAWNPLHDVLKLEPPVEVALPYLQPPPHVQVCQNSVVVTSAAEDGFEEDQVRAILGLVHYAFANGDVNRCEPLPPRKLEGRVRLLCLDGREATSASPSSSASPFSFRVLDCHPFPPVLGWKSGQCPESPLEYSNCEGFARPFAGLLTVQKPFSGSDFPTITRACFTLSSPDPCDPPSWCTESLKFQLDTGDKLYRRFVFERREFAKGACTLYVTLADPSAQITLKDWESLLGRVLYKNKNNNCWNPQFKRIVHLWVECGEQQSNTLDRVIAGGAGGGGGSAAGGCSASSRCVRPEDTACRPKPSLCKQEKQPCDKNDEADAKPFPLCKVKDCGPIRLINVEQEPLVVFPGKSNARNVSTSINVSGGGQGGIDKVSRKQGKKFNREGAVVDITSALVSLKGEVCDNQLRVARHNKKCVPSNLKLTVSADRTRVKIIGDGSALDYQIALKAVVYQPGRSDSAQTRVEFVAFDARRKRKSNTVTRYVQHQARIKKKGEDPDCGGDGGDAAANVNYLTILFLVLASVIMFGVILNRYSNNNKGRQNRSKN